MKVTGTNLSMTRGDSESITVSADNRPFSGGDRIEMTVRKRPEAEDVEMYKLVENFDSGKAVIEIKPEDTAEMSFGTHYYDVQLTMADGTVTTIIKPSTLYLDKEVTYGRIER